MAKHSLYDSSPEMKRGEDGKMAVKKSEKKEASSKGTNEPDGAGLQELLKEHKAMKDMHDKHEGDMMARIAKHVKESGAAEGSKTAGEPTDKAEKGDK